MLRKATAILLFAASIPASALSVKHVERASVALNGSQMISQEQQQELRGKLRRAESVCVYPPDFVVTLELITLKADSANSVPQTAVVKDLLIANGIQSSQIFEGEISAKQFRSRQQKNAPVRLSDIGSVEVEIVCTSKE